MNAKCRAQVKPINHLNKLKPRNQRILRTKLLSISENWKFFADWVDFFLCFCSLLFLFIPLVQTETWTKTAISGEPVEPAEPTIDVTLLRKYQNNGDKRANPTACKSMGLPQLGEPENRWIILWLPVFAVFVACNVFVGLWKAPELWVNDYFRFSFSLSKIQWFNEISYIWNHFSVERISGCFGIGILACKFAPSNIVFKNPIGFCLGI